MSQLSKESRTEEIVTNTLSREQILDQMRQVIDFLVSEGIEKVWVQYGWGCEIRTQDLWQSTMIDLSGLERFVCEAEQRAIYRVGHGDLIVGNEVADFELLFCHESDIHFKSRDFALIEKMKTLWKEANLTVMRKISNGEWTQVTE